jgi:hypothetical protein
VVIRQVLDVNSINRGSLSTVFDSTRWHRGTGTSGVRRWAGYRYWTRDDTPAGVGLSPWGAGNAAFVRMRRSRGAGATHMYECVAPKAGQLHIRTNARFKAPRLAFRPTPAGRVPSWPGAPAPGRTVQPECIDCGAHRTGTEPAAKRTLDARQFPARLDPGGATAPSSPELGPPGVAPPPSVATRRLGPAEPGREGDQGRSGRLRRPAGTRAVGCPEITQVGPLLGALQVPSQRASGRHPRLRGPFGFAVGQRAL